MLSSTPERPSLPTDRSKALASGGQYSLPPLTALLTTDSTPFRPKLPSIGMITTPQTPRHMHLSTMGAITSSTLKEYPHAPFRVAKSGPSSSGTTLSDRLRPTITPANTSASLDSDADVSGVNDSMTKPASKRKHSNSASPTRDFAFISHSPATYPSQEPCIDNASLARRKRRRTSPNELALLNQEFVLGSTPDKTRRISIAKKVNMTEKAVQIWFQNKRQSLRRIRISEKEITVLPPTPDSTTATTGLPTDTAPTPLFESTPIRPSIIKSQSQNFSESPSVSSVSQQSPLRSFSTPDLLQRPQTHPPALNKMATSKTTVLSKILASSREDKKDAESSELVLNLTNKKQPEFARQSASASTQVRTFRLTPKERKPLATIEAGILNTPASSICKDSQCVESLLSLKAGSQ